MLVSETTYTVTLTESALTFSDDNQHNSEHRFSFTTDSTSGVFTVSADTWYEDLSTDNGSFSATISIGFPTGIDANTSLTGIFDTPLGDRVGDESIPVTIAGLPSGVDVQMTKETTGVVLQLTGNADSHQKKTDNTTLSLTFLSDFFDTSDPSLSTGISFSFDILFTSLRWPSRYSHQSFVYDDKIWVLAGIVSDSGTSDDLWYSDDKGTNWYQVPIAGTKWQGKRFGHQSFGYDGKLWLSGGELSQSAGITRGTNDVWISADGGTNWSQVSTENPFLQRAYHQSFVHDDKLWVLGGLNFYFGTYGLDDIWTSADGGVNWVEVVVNTNSEMWSVRNEHQAFFYDNKLWVLGGYDSVKKNDIWTSADGGTNWSEISIPSGGSRWSGRQGHQSFVHDDKLWVLGGNTISSENNDIWTSADGGTNWSQVSVNGNQWSKRHRFQAFSYDDKLWVLGGLDNVNNYKNDIWYSADNGTNWVEIVHENY